MNKNLFEATKAPIRGGEVYPGYPNQRLVMEKPTKTSDGLLNIPDGPWAASEDQLPSPAETEKFRDNGYEVDSAGRPLHPWHEQMLADPDVGVLTGKGKYYNWGPNYTVDPVVVAGEVGNRKILLIKRGDTGCWALPGGFVDNTDPDTVCAAKRELGEEAHLFELAEPTAQIYKGPVADIRATIHAWPETTAYLWNIDQPVAVESDDDAVDAKWFDENDLPKTLFGSHAEMIRLALDYQHPKKLKDIFNLPPETLKITTALGGHMAYDHLLIDSPDDQLFAKIHNPKRFDDPIRENHSKNYLQKEYLFLKHLNLNNYNHIPKRCELINDTALVMDAMRNDSGWQWRIPNDGDAQEKYISDSLRALDNLNKIQSPNTSYHKLINPTYGTLWREGWDSISDDKMINIKKKLEKVADIFDGDKKTRAVNLLDNIENLQSLAKNIEKTNEFVLSHGDARQSNIAWHPNHGVKIVDWSWADMAPKKSDSTMFLIDLAKSGHDVSPYMERYFSYDHAITLIGFWLAHSIWQPRDGDETVRIQQIASAAAAYELILITN